MAVEYEKLRFWDAYGVAEFVRQSLEENPLEETFDDYFDLSQPKTRTRCTSPCRWTLLHQFVATRYQEYYVEAMEHDRDDMRDLIISEYETVLRGYDIATPSYEIPPEMSEQYDSVTAGVICDLRNLLPIARIVGETFQLLFANRLFLKTFNEIVACVVRDTSAERYPDCFERDGMLRRACLPVWAKRGVFFRDQGRCVLCGKDLTGTVVTGEELAYDHIVPLELL